MSERARQIKDKDFSWVKAVVFDLDGTLIDSAPDLTAALNLVLEMEGLEPLESAQVRFMIGSGVPKLIERGFRARGVTLEAENIDSELLDAFLSYYDAHAADLTKVYPGAYDLLVKLDNKSIKIGMCTNKPTEATREILASFQLGDLFSSVIGGTSGFPKKPDPAGLLACLDELGSDASDTLYIGDSAIDVATAKGAKLPVIVMSYGYESTDVSDLGAELVIDKFTQLTAAFGKLSGTSS